jgi:hypothetical protein
MIYEVFKKLERTEQEQLMYAFENEFSYFVRVNGHKFIGVHMNTPPQNLRIIESDGSWAYGEIISG